MLHTLSVEDVVKQCLTFDDVLLVPRHAQNVKSRLDPRLNTSIGSVKLDVPIVSANMSTITELNMMVAMADAGCLGILHRFLPIEQQRDVVVNARSKGLQDVAVSIGVSPGYLADTELLIEAGANVVCVDVAHGDSAKVIEVVKTIRKEFPYVTVIAGNIATPSAALRLASAGAKVLKVGIGPGCFVSGTLVRTDKGLIPIQCVKVGDKVYTHKNRLKFVVNVFEHKEKNDLVVVNNISATPNHEFYVLHKSKIDVVSDDNVHELAEWISAKDLSKDYVLLKRK